MADEFNRDSQNTSSEDTLETLIEPAPHAGEDQSNPETAQTTNEQAEVDEQRIANLQQGTAEYYEIEEEAYVETRSERDEIDPFAAFEAGEQADILATGQTDVANFVSATGAARTSADDTPIDQQDRGALLQETPSQTPAGDAAPSPAPEPLESLRSGLPQPENANTILPEEPVSELEDPALEAEDPTPVAEDPAPVAEDPAPEAEDPAPVAEDPTPEAEDPAPVAEDPAPEAEEPTSEAEDPAPEAEEPTSEAEDPAPEAEEPTSETEDPAPEAEEPTSEAEDPAPESEEPTSETEDPAPDTEDPAPDPEEPTSEVEEPSPTDDPDPTENQAPVDLTATLQALSENDAGAQVATVSASDPDGDALVYSTDDARFEVVDGALKLRDGVSLDHEAEPEVTLTLTATDPDGASTSQTLTIAVGDVNEAPVDLTATLQALSENDAGAQVATVSASDPDGDALVYSTDDARFEVVDGALKLRDGVSLDHEAEPEVTLTLTATDPDGASTSQTLTIAVGDVNEAPVDLTATLQALAENDAGAQVATVSASDPDGDALVYSTDDARFEVVDGALKLRDGVSLDHEAEPEVTLTLTATDPDGASTSQALTIAVGDVNEAPVDLTATLQALAENDAGAQVATVSASDPDGDALVYSTDDARFEVVDGALKLRDGVSLDQEAEPEVTLTLTATDPDGASTSQTLTIAVGDVNEAPVDLTATLQALSENDAGAQVATVSASDPDGDALVYSTDDARFEVVDGALKLRDGVSLDHEAEPEVTLTLTATDPDGASTSQALTIAVGDVNEAPVDLTATLQALAENDAGAQVATVSASDPDGDALVYSTDDARFEVVDGALKLRDGVSLDHEAEPEVTLTLTATDPDGASTSQTLTIAVGDVNEAPVDLTATLQALSENDAGAQVATVSASDPDGDALVYSTDDARFEVVDGALKLRDGVSLDHEAEPEVTLTLTATDPDGASTSQTLTIAVGDVNEAPVDLTATLQALSENDAGAQVATVSASDPDGDALVYSTDDARFEVVDGALKLRDGVSLDHEAEPEVTLTLTATDPDGASTSQTLTIAVGDVNEAPVDLTATLQALSENDAGAQVATVSASDPDGDALVYSTDDARFEVVDGALKLRDGVSLDHEAEPEVTLTLTATDPDGASTSQTLTIAVGDVNEAPVDLTATLQALSENDAGAQVATVSASDPDGDALVYSTDDARFEVVDGALKLRDGVSLDHEAEPEVTLTLTATDPDGASTSQTLTIAVGDVNEAPVDLTATLQALSENDAGAQVATVSASDPDGDALVYSTDDARFEVVDGALKLRDGVSLDHEAEPEVTLTLTATDPDGASTSQTLTIAVGDEVVAAPDVSTGTAFNIKQFDLSDLGDAEPTLLTLDWEADPTSDRYSTDLDLAFSDTGPLALDVATLVQGSFDVPAGGGSFVFQLSSSGAANLFIDNEPVVFDVNTGPVDLGENLVTLNLSEGVHTVTIQQIDVSDDPFLKLDWKPDDPAADFSTMVASETPVVEQGETLGFPIDIQTGANAIQSVSLQGVPSNWYLSSDADFGTPDGSGALDVTGWDLSQLAISPSLDTSVGDYTLSIVTEVASPTGEVETFETEVTLEVSPDDDFGLADLLAELNLTTDPDPLASPLLDPVIPDAEDGSDPDIIDVASPDPAPSLGGLL